MEKIYKAIVKFFVRIFTRKGRAEKRLDKAVTKSRQDFAKLETREDKRTVLGNARAVKRRAFRANVRYMKRAGIMLANGRRRPSDVNLLSGRPWSKAWGYGDAYGRDTAIKAGG